MRRASKKTNESNGVVTHPCIRCGKERIIGKQWEEEMVTSVGGVSVVTHVRYVCPDEDCQKRVQEKLDEQFEVSRERERVSQERMQARMGRIGKKAE